MQKEISEKKKKALPYLREIQEVFAKDLEVAEHNTRDFDKPNWAIRQAYYKGLKEGLTKVEKYVII